MLIKLFLGHPVDFVWQKKWWTIPDQWSPITRSEIGGQLTLACPKLQDTVKRPKPLKVRKNPRTGPPSRACLWTLEWGRKPCQDGPGSGPGRAGDVWTLRPGWRQVRASAGLTARRWLAEPTPPRPPGHTQAHLSGRAVPHSVLTLCSTLPAQRCTFSPSKRTVLCKWIIFKQLPNISQRDCGEREQWITEWLNILIIVLR